MYCSRDGTADTSSHLKRRTLFTIDLGKDITPIYNKEDHPLLKKYKALCEKPAFELKILTKMLAQNYNHRSSTASSRPKKALSDAKKRLIHSVHLRTKRKLKLLVTRFYSIFEC